MLKEMEKIQVSYREISASNDVQRRLSKKRFRYTKQYDTECNDEYGLAAKPMIFNTDLYFTWRTYTQHTYQ